MDKRKYKRAISIEKAREWLRRVEENDETPPQISKADFVDVRTVRKQIIRAREERELKESKQAVFRGALEKHFADLVSFTKKLKTSLSKETPVSLSADLKGAPLFRSLKEHLPRVRLWKDIESLLELETNYNQSIKSIKEKIMFEAKNNTTLEFVSVPGKYGLYDGLIEALRSYLEGMARGWRNVDLIEYREMATADGIRIEFGAYTLGFAPTDKVKVVKELFDDMKKESLQWEEYTELSNIMAEFIAIKGRIEDELLKIILRRVVPGKCVYCPF